MGLPGDWGDRCVVEVAGGRRKASVLELEWLLLDRIFCVTLIGGDILKVAEDATR